jgi:hypothetical protein
MNVNCSESEIKERQGHSCIELRSVCSCLVVPALSSAIFFSQFCDANFDRNGWPYVEVKL